MVVWGAIAGAVFGTLAQRLGESTFVGAIWGAVLGLWLRSLINKQVNAKTAQLKKELLAQLHTELKKQPAPTVQASAEVAPQASLRAAMQEASPDTTLQTKLDQALERQATQQTIAAAPQEPKQERTQEPVSDWPEFEAEKAPSPLLNPDFARVNRTSGASTAARPPEPPNVVEQVVAAAKAWLLGGNTIVRVGIVILFLGLSFLARFAVAAGLFPIELRMAAIGAVGIALLAVGFRKRGTRPGFALSLQGAGVAVMYLTVFAAFRLYGLLPAGFAFGVMLLICAFSCALALMQNSLAMAFMAFAGGFACPILLSTGQGSHVGLFSYYTVLNVAIMFMAYKRSWRLLNLLGFVATFVIAGAWGALRYQATDYASTQPFLIGFLLIFVATAIFYARNTPTALGNAVDSTLVFGTPLVCFGLQAGLVNNMPALYTAFSALGFGALYLGLATLLASKARENYRLLIECFIALGVGFATLAVPLALDAKWTSAVWAIEGLGAFWVGMRQARWMPRAFGLLLQGVAAFMVLPYIAQNTSAWPLLHPAFIGAMMVALPAFVLSSWLRAELPHSESSWAKAYATFESNLSSPVFVASFIFWCIGWSTEIHRDALNVANDSITHVWSNNWQQLLTMLMLLASSGLSLWWGTRKNWPIATVPARLSVLVMLLTCVLQLLSDYRVLSWPAYLIWPIALALHVFMLNKAERSAVSPISPGIAHWIHAAGVWLLVLLVADMLLSAIRAGELASSSWASVVLLVSTVLVLLLLSIWAARSKSTGQRWPLAQHAVAYCWTAALPLALMVFIGTLFAAMTSEGRTQPLPYIPLLNPVDLTIGLAIFALLLWRRNVLSLEHAPLATHQLSAPAVQAALLGLIFIAINSVWLRVAHHFFGVNWSAGDLFDSFVVQTGYAILWTLTAFATMLFAHRQHSRSTWLVGAGLLGVVVLKLLVLDLSNRGGAERIIAFISVGVLMLIVGYFAPLPPKATTSTESAPYV